MDLIQACKQLCIKDPFYGLFLLALNKKYSELDCETSCIRQKGINFEIVVNPIYWKGLNDQQQLALLKHNIIHLCFKHIWMYKQFSNKIAFSLACELETNSYVGNFFPKWETSAKYGFAPKLGTKKYYELIKNNPNLVKIPEHECWKQFEELTESEQELLSNQIDFIARNTATEVLRTAGKIPGELTEYIEVLFKKDPPIFNWRSYFRRLIGYSFKQFIKKTHKRPSKRFPDSVGMKMKRKQHILVAVDTSGSVNKKELQEFFNEIHYIYNTGATVDIIECDYKIQRIYPYKGKFEGKIKGGGGTLFSPVINHYNKYRDSYSTLVFFTDGFAPIDDFKVTKQMIWVITSNGNKDNKYPGYTIFIPEEHGLK